jgi:hypothetical protein
MNFGKYLFGFRPEYLSKSEEDVRRNQFFAFNVLAFMLWVLVILSFTSAVCYGLIIFQSWWMAIVTGLLFGGISFLLMLLVLYLNMTTQYKDLYEKMTHMDPVFQEFKKSDLESISDEKALLAVTDFTMALRAANSLPDPRSTHGSSFFTNAIKLVMILIISFIVANGMEMLMFRNKINESMSVIRNSKVLKENLKIQPDESVDRQMTLPNEYSLHAEWILNMVDEKKGTFILIECHSILLIAKVMDEALGGWKILIDVLFSALFLIPFIVVRRSRFIAGGDFLKEAAIADISTSLMFFILSERKCRQIRFQLENEYDYEKLMEKQ